MVMAILDATAYPAADNGTYILPGMDFYVAFGLVGTWLLATVVRELRRRATAADAPLPPVERASSTHSPQPETPTATPRTVLVP